MCHVADRVHLISNHCSGDDRTLIGSLIWDFSWYIGSRIFLAWWRCTGFPNSSSNSCQHRKGNVLCCYFRSFCCLHTQALSVCLSSCQDPHSNKLSHWLCCVSQQEPVCSSTPTSIAAQNSIPPLILPVHWLASNQSWLKDFLHEDFTNLYYPCHPALLYVLISALICPTLISSWSLLFSHPLPNCKDARVRIMSSVSTQISDTKG